jgi:hypothetical protein
MPEGMTYKPVLFFGMRFLCCGQSRGMELALYS